jgi:hypothetical protein
VSVAQVCHPTVVDVAIARNRQVNVGSVDPVRLLAFFCFLLVGVFLLGAAYIAGAEGLCDQTTCGDHATNHAWQLGLLISAAASAAIGVGLVWWIRRHRD